MKSYKIWLGLTCQWAANGLTADSFKDWSTLTTELNKRCPDCQEGEICLSCHNTGLNLTEHEKSVLKAIDKCLE